MGNIKFTFQKNKAIEVILYLAKRAKKSDLHSIAKLLYVADKMSLEKYGRFICGDDYYAMEWGPVPTNTYDVMKYEGSGNSPFRTDGHLVRALRDADLDQLSESDTECLDASLMQIGELSFPDRHRETADPAYLKAWNARGGSKSFRMNIEDIAQLLEHSDELINYLSHRG